MTDFIIGLVFVIALIGTGLVFVRHSNKVRQEMFDEMDQELEGEAWWSAPDWEEEKEEKPEEPKPAPKKRRGRSKKKNG